MKKILEDGRGNIAEIEPKMMGGKQFARLVRCGYNLSEVRLSPCHKVGILHTVGRVPDVAYDFVEGNPDEVTKYLSERGFK